MFHHYPRPIEVVVEDKAPRPFEPGYTIDCSLLVKGPPDGSIPTFPAGSEIELWYYRVTNPHMTAGATLYQYPNGLWDGLPYMGGNEYTGDNGVGLSKIGPITVSLSALAWTEIPTWWGGGSPPPWLRTWKSNVVLSMQGHEWEGGWTYYAPGEYWDYSNEYPAIDLNGPWTTSAGPFYTDLSDASVSAIAASSGDVNNSNWKQYPTGFLTYGNSNYLGILGSVTITRKGISDYLSGGDWYTAASITDSTADGYTVGDGIDPYVRPTGFRLTAQTATSRTWTRDESHAFTITLSMPFDFNAWKEQQYGPMADPDGIYLPPNDKDRRWFDATDCVDFVISRVGEPATSTNEFTTVQGVTFQDGDTDSHWRLTCGTVSGDGLVADIPSDIGSATIYCWNKDDGITEKTVTFSKESCYLGGNVYPFYGTYMIWRSASFEEDNYPVAIKSLSGQIATGLAEGTGLYTINNLRGSDPMYARIPVTE